MTQLVRVGLTNLLRLSIADLTLQLVTPTAQKKIGEEARVLLGGQNLSNQAKTYT